MIDPIQISVTIPLAPRDAFELFTARIAEWWPLSAGHSLSVERADACFIEPFAGGRVFERDVDGNEHDWGKVLAYEPPHRVSMTWHPGGGPETEVEVRFTPADDGTLVELEHRNWDVFGDHAAGARDGYLHGWPFVFGERFVAAARA